MDSSFYITLAKESPQRIYESDISDDYDDRNEIETGYAILFLFYFIILNLLMLVKEVVGFQEGI